MVRALRCGWRSQTAMVIAGIICWLCAASSSSAFIGSSPGNIASGLSRLSPSLDRRAARQNISPIWPSPASGVPAFRPTTNWNALHSNYSSLITSRTLFASPASPGEYTVQEDRYSTLLECALTCVAQPQKCSGFSYLGPSSSCRQSCPAGLCAHHSLCGMLPYDSLRFPFDSFDSADQCGRPGSIDSYCSAEFGGRGRPRRGKRHLTTVRSPAYSRQLFDLAGMHRAP